MSERRIAYDLSRDTTLCVSLSGRPSNIGTRFHNHLYDELGLDFVYKAFTTDDIAAAVAGIRGLQIRGASVSMPWKEDVIPLVDELAPSAAAIESVNTIVNHDGNLVAHNTDYAALVSLLASAPEQTTGFVVLGSGGMAKAAVAALRDSGVRNGTVVARNPETGRSLAEKYGFEWRDSLGDLRPELILNATPVGMADGSRDTEMPVPIEAVQSARTIVDVVAFPSQTPLIRAAQEAGKQVVTGAEVIALQAAEQFVLYTGVRPTDDQVRRASEFSRA